MNFNELQNAVLQALRQKGVNWSGTPSNTSTDLVPPALVQGALNRAYNRFLALVKDYPIATLRIPILSQANAPSIPLNPLPSYGRTLNPAVMQVYEMTYQPSQGSGASLGQERYIPFVSTKKFRDYTAGYQARLGYFAQWPDYVTQRFGQRIIDMAPGTSNSNDTIWLTVCPDPMATQRASYGGAATPPACAQGGLISLGTDVPLLPDEYHSALVEGAVMEIARYLDKQEIFQNAQGMWNSYIQEALDFGSTVAEGDAEQQVGDYYGGEMSGWGPF